MSKPMKLGSAEEEEQQCRQAQEHRRAGIGLRSSHAHSHPRNAPRTTTADRRVNRGLCRGRGPTGLLTKEYFKSRLPRGVHNLFRCTECAGQRGNDPGFASSLFRQTSQKYWASCNAFLLKLARFRNALAHWQPYSNLYETPDGKRRFEPALGPPAANGLKPLEARDFPAFITDCEYIQSEIQKLDAIIIGGPGAWAEKFQPPAIRQNQAVLRSRQTPKELQPHRPPSKPKPLQKGRTPSAKQRRQRALGISRSRPG